MDHLSRQTSLASRRHSQKFECSGMWTIDFGPVIDYCPKTFPSGLGFNREVPAMIRPFYELLFRRFLCWAILPTAFVFVAVAFATSRPPLIDSVRHPSTDLHFPLVISPNPLLLGTLSPGHATVGKFFLHNPGRVSITIERIVTSCPCLTINPAPIEVGPGLSTALIVRFDPAEDRDFRGGLSIEVAGFETNGKVVFRTRVSLKVRAEGLTDPG